MASTSRRDHRLADNRRRCDLAQGPVHARRGEERLWVATPAVHLRRHQARLRAERRPFALCNLVRRDELAARSKTPTCLGTAAKSRAATAWAAVPKTSFRSPSCRPRCSSSPVPAARQVHPRHGAASTAAIPGRAWPSRPRGEGGPRQRPGPTPVPLTPFKPRSRPLSLSEARRCSRRGSSERGGGHGVDDAPRRPRRLHLSGFRSHLAADLFPEHGFAVVVQRVLPPRRRQTGSCRRRRGCTRQQTAGSTGGFSAPASACRR